MFDLREIHKIVRTQNCQIWNFFATRFAYIAIANLINALALFKMTSYWDLKKTEMSSKQRFGFTDNQ